MKLSIVIGAYNQKDVLKLTLESLFRQTLSPDLYEIQLIDSSSFDGTDKMVEGLKPPCRFNYVRVENRGKAGARNFGIKKAAGEIIFLTDADMAAAPNLLQEHLAAHEKKENASFEGLTINPDGNPYIKKRLHPLQKLGWNYSLTGNLSVRKRTLIEAGLFDENFKGYGWEDIELGYRLNQMKIPLYYLPSALNYHNHPVSDAGMLERKFETGRSAALFYRKHPALEVKMLLGMNPLAMFIFRAIKNRPSLMEFIHRREKKSIFYRYLSEEYQYRLGLEEGLKNL